MSQTAIFVDAGYLHAQGSALLIGQKQARNLITLDVGVALRCLCEHGKTCAPTARLLRTYWYDGLQRSGRLSSEQEQIAGAQYTKLRLGVVNSQGDQKGVDSLIVTDLIDLARNRAITDAVLVSGDEDIRIGVQIAQTFGVQIHLLGIKPARGSQSPDLIREADTHHEWDETKLASMMEIRRPADEKIVIQDLPTQPEPKDSSTESVELGKAVKQAIDDTLDSLDQSTLDAALRAFRINPVSVPPELDRPTLGRLKSILKRDLSEDERKAYRLMLKTELSNL